MIQETPQNGPHKLASLEQNHGSYVTIWQHKITLYKFAMQEAITNSPYDWKK